MRLVGTFHYFLHTSAVTTAIGEWVEWCLRTFLSKALADVRPVCVVDDRGLWGVCGCVVVR